MAQAYEILYTKIPHLNNHATCSICGSPVGLDSQDLHTKFHLDNGHVTTGADNEVTVKLVDGGPTTQEPTSAW